MVISSAKLHFNHPQGTNDDRFWALALAVYAADQVHPASRPSARTTLRVLMSMFRILGMNDEALLECASDLKKAYS